MQTEGKKHSTNKKQKVQASEMIMLMMTQGQKKKKKELVWLVIVKQEMGLEGAQGLSHARLCQLS